MEKQRIVVIGGGAAGFFGAIAATHANPQTTVTLYEAGPECLAKVRISGGGRCNVTHHCFDPAQLVQNYPRGGKALRGAFSRFQPQDTIAWYRQRGVKLKTEADGRMFPITDDSATIVDCLMQSALQAGVTIKTKAPVKQVIKTRSGFAVGLREGDVKCDRILLATGSSPQGHRIAKSLGHTIEPPVPSLFTFTIKDSDLRQRSGLSMDPVEIKLKLPGHKKPLTQTGPVLITHWGLSGPAVLKLSAWGARALHDQGYQGTVLINWLPQLSQDNVRAQLQTARSEGGKRAISNHNPTPAPKRLWTYFVQRAQIKSNTQWTTLSNKAINKLTQELCQGEYALQGKGVFKDEFVTCGGIRLKEVNFKTMESRLCSNLFFAGEILDIDGITGGFNFQSAWTTGWLAGQGIKDSLT
ncbi:BaiN/RdsA family NAD(P)/FAD-dependent oxidoreductase [Leptothoe spongobia]|uniref:NAD(P)/FAD-dependent oxidoreductase n=1 Tax=Leptothoe spongobia TAU-MAC 1115 TaxID=1967444 RepID=A0A947DIA1_9CYAN|nr:aminoacetone oxidase family FAD-binding enzyme [Leptothoe spongobia]MBT9317163.1 NAD(P)/FAD-dependent oxidoreductase [Leptothoe spongobia TAU-MAC 1115]